MARRRALPRHPPRAARRSARASGLGHARATTRQARRVNWSALGCAEDDLAELAVVNGVLRVRVFGALHADRRPASRDARRDVTVAVAIVVVDAVLADEGRLVLELRLHDRMLELHAEHPLVASGDHVLFRLRMDALAFRDDPD